MLIARLEQDELSHDDRLLIGKKLAEFGDPRHGVGLRPDGLPDIEWLEIPPGRIRLKEIDHVFEVTPFRMAKYPVTNAQFEAFVRAKDGYGQAGWWKGIQRSKAPETPRWPEANGPRETVSWFEAIAFCRWLSARTGTTIRLPTEWEWQQAATGGDPDREYPWEGGWDAARCNSSESRLDRTTAVGLYPRGATQQGIMDMAGNVWEWCLNRHEQPERPESLRIDAATAERVLRGGSWYDGSVDLRFWYRHRRQAVEWNFNLGFRLVQDLP
jgi:formylglycine-generating enzyme required for sulfatase activity